ncbi:AlkZ-related protein [Clostridium cellulovorans]|uniref:Uncharacterized protein n=1 Tax=Clostridium cellulovorans (strain ATCC 35296 / DSM 3052 / OCM 3 / 743B) TaxID=573061 RepID=D9STA6_CLOC7|nr:hypothetical protein [Clostridium cellulovorans]ADL50722.1 hypothetical protein Clocel_0956 [Clostridium cellulovorans 743B]
MSIDYTNKKITEYKDFVAIVEEVGFMPFSKNSLGFINLDDLTVPEQWHTNLPSDPWPWRVDIERDGKAAYGKLFGKKPGFISLKWYPTFLAARRKGRSFQEAYSDGLMSNYAKQIYNLFEEHEILAVHEIKTLLGITKETNSQYEAAMCELQMGMFITVNGTKQKINSKGEPYGWPSTAYSTVETWVGQEMIEDAESIIPEDAMDEILEKIYEFIPDAKRTKLKSFIGF